MILFAIITIAIFMLLFLLGYEKESSVFSKIWLGVKSIFISFLASMLIIAIIGKMVSSISDKTAPVYEEKYIIQSYYIDNKEYYSIPVYYEDYGDMNFVIVKINNDFKRLDVKYDDNCPKENVVYTKVTHLKYQWLEKAVGMRYYDEKLVYKTNNNKILNIKTEN